MAPDGTARAFAGRLTIRGLAWGLVAAAAVLRVVTAVQLASSGEEWFGDARVYLRIAEGLRNLRVVPDAWIWPPGYPLLGAVFALFGGPDRGLLLTSLLCGAALPFLVLAVAGRARPVEAGTAAVFVAFAPAAVLVAAQPLSEATALLTLVGAGVLVERSARRGSVAESVAGGLVAALSILIRPEALLALGPLALLALTCGRRAWGPVAVFVGVVTLAVAPYVVSLHAESGIWALTLKGQLNLHKMHVYQGETTYVESRDAWGQALAELRNEAGELDPARVARVASPRDFVLSGNATRSWLVHMKQAATWNPPWLLAVVGLGLAGLLLPGRGGRERAIAGVLSLPFLAVPVFLTPSGRFLLPLLPGVAWGIGSLAERISERVLARPAVIAGSLAAVGLAVLGTMSTREQASSLVWNATIREVETALTEADLARAERLLLRSSDRDAETPEFQSLLGRLHEAKDDAAAAEEAYRKAVRLGGSPVQLADFLARQGRFSEANACLQSLRAAPPEETAYWLLEGNLAFVAKRWDAAETALRKAEELGGPTQALAFNRALALVGAGRLAEARRQFDRAAAGPDSALAARAMAELDRLRR